VGGEGAMAAWRNMVFQSSPPLAAIRARIPNAQVTFDEGRYPAAAAMRALDADAVIVFANQWMIEDQDAPDMTLPEGQDALIAAVAAANPHTIVVLQTGGAIAMPWLEQTAAVLAAWYSGAGGADAIADVLFGQVNPSGRLPVTFPSGIDQYPRPQIPGWGLTGNDKVDAPHEEGAAVGYRWMAQRGQGPLLPFGFGLSYTSFEYRDLEVVGGNTVTLRFAIKNVGERAGADVPQAYLVSAAGSKLMRLVGFRRMALAPGETQHVELRVDSRLLANFDERAQRWRVTAGEYEVAVGKSSGELVLIGSTRVAGATIKP
jgi:beta-glucosidase